MKKILAIFLILILVLPLYGQEAFKSAGRTSVRYDTTTGSKAFGRLISTKEDSLLWMGTGFALKQVATSGDSFSLMKLHLDTLAGFSTDTVFTKADMVFLQDILFKASTTNKSYWIDSGGDTVVVIDPNVSGNPSLYLISTDKSDTLRLYHNNTDGYILTEGKLVLGGHKKTNNENLQIDFETTSNEIGLSSGTGATIVDLKALNLETAAKFDADYAEAATATDPTRYYDFRTDINANQNASADGLATLYGRINWNKDDNSNVLLHGVEGVASSSKPDESVTLRGGYFRTYVQANADATGSTARTNIGADISARAGYSGGNAVNAESGSAFVGARIWMAPYFASVANINNFHGLWIYNEHPTNAVTNAIMVNNAASGGYTNGLNFTAANLTNEIVGSQGEYWRNTTNDKWETDAAVIIEDSIRVEENALLKQKLVVLDSIRVEESALFKQKAVILDSVRVEESALFKQKAVVNDSLRVEKTSLLKGIVTANTKLIINDSLRVEETSLLKGTVTTLADISVGTKAVVNDSLRVEETSLIKGKGTFNDSLVVIKGLRNESISTLKGNVDARTKVVIGDSLRVEETSLLKGIVTANTTLIVNDSLRVEESVLFKQKAVVNDSFRVEKTSIQKGNAQFDGKVVIDDSLRSNGLILGKNKLIVEDSLRVEETSLLKGNVTANTKLIVNDSLRVEETALIKGKGTFNDSLVTIKGFRNESISTLKGNVDARTKVVIGDSLRVEETSLLKGIVTANTTLIVNDSLRVEETARLKGTVTAGATATPLQILTTGDIRGLSTAGHRLQMDALGATFVQTKSLLLENQTAAANNAQQMSPALVFKGNGWKTDGTAASDSTKWAIYTLPVQGAAAPTSNLYFSSKIGTGSWSTSNYISSSGWMYATVFSIGTSGALHSSVNMNLTDGTVANVKNVGTGALAFWANNTEYMRLSSTGSLGLGTTAPVSSSLTLGTKATQRDIIVTRENTPAGTDSVVILKVDDGNGKLDLKAGDADSLVLTTSTSIASIKSNNPIEIISDKTTFGNTTDDDEIIIDPTTKGTASYAGTITTTGDLTANRTYELTDYNGVFWVTGTRFQRPNIICETDFTPAIKTDGATNYILNNSLGTITYREEQAHTIRSWVEVATGISIDGDNTEDNEGVEIYFADGVNETLGDGWIRTGTVGGKFLVEFTIANISATDQLLIGWRSCVAFDGANNYTNYVEHQLLGITATDGSVFSSSRVPAIAVGAQQTDDSGTNLTDATSHTFQVDISSAGVPTAYLDGVAVTLTNSGGTHTTATAMAPMITYLHGAEAADPGIVINRISIYR